MSKAPWAWKAWYCAFIVSGCAFIKAETLTLEVIFGLLMLFCIVRAEHILRRRDDE